MEDQIVADQERRRDEDDGADQKDCPADLPQNLSRAAFQPVFFRLQLHTKRLFHDRSPDNLHLGFEGISGLFKNPLLNQGNQAEDLLRGRLPPVDNEIRMFFGDLGVADPGPLEPGLFDEPAGGAIPRVLEDGTGIPEFQRMFFPSHSDDFPDASGDVFSVSPPQTESCADDNRFRRQVKVSVCKMKLLPRGGADRARSIEEAYGFNDVLDLPPVGPGIHPDGAAHAAGDAGAELHPRERFAAPTGSPVRTAGSRPPRAEERRPFPHPGGSGRAGAQARRGRPGIRRPGRSGWSSCRPEERRSAGSGENRRSP